MPDHSPVRAIGATEVVELTPVGRGAVAVVLVDGPDALPAVEPLFAPASGRRLGEVPVKRIAFGHFGGPDGEEVVACRRSHEYVEIHCHGGTAAVSAIIGRLVDGGCRHVSWQEWMRRKCGDPTRAAARIALADAPTARTAAILLDQYHGALAKAIGEIVVAIESAGWQQAVQTIDSLLAHRDVGMHLATPWRVVLTGPTNVGKSSLINALAGFQRAIVSPQHGTTRDVVTTITAIDGWPVELADTAGIRDPEDALEMAGIELAEKTLFDADLVVAVRDATQPPDNAGDGKIAVLLSRVSQRRLLLALNKIDLLPRKHGEVPVRDEPHPRRHEVRGPRIVHTSAVARDGIDDLMAAIAEAIVPRPPAPGSAVPFTAAQNSALQAALIAVAAHDAASSLAALQPLLAGV